MKKKAAIYVRVSTEEQAREGYSIDAQINVLKLYAKLYDLEIVKIYKDKGISGKDLNRKKLKQLLLDAEERIFDTVIVWKVSRLSRNLRNLLTIVDKLDNLGISFISQSETFNTSNPVGRMTLQILGSIAEFERNTIIENIKLALNEKAKRGEWLGGRVFGYKNIGKKLVVDEYESKYIKYIFKSYLNGKSVKDIVRQLNKNKVLTTRNNKFSASSVYRILNNSIYCGILKHNSSNENEKFEIEGLHKKIISTKEFQKVQNKISKGYKQKSGNSEFVLSGLLKCPYCMGSLVRYKTSKYRYYRCGVYHNYGKDKCKGFLINANIIENEIYKKVENKLDNKTHKFLYDRFDIKEVFEKNFILNLRHIKAAKRKEIIKHFVKEIILTENKTIDKILFAI